VIHSRIEVTDTESKTQARLDSNAIIYRTISIFYGFATMGITNWYLHVTAAAMVNMKDWAAIVRQIQDKNITIIPDSKALFVWAVVFKKAVAAEKIAF
jgi:hypothetical protein